MAALQTGAVDAAKISVTAPELRELFKELDIILALVKSTRRLAEELHQGVGGILRVAAIPALMQAFLPRAVELLRRDYPHVRALIRSPEPAAVKDAVVRREFDVGVVFAEDRRESLEVEELCRAPIVCLLRRDDPLAEHPVLTPKLLCGVPLISHPELSPIGSSLDDIFSAENSSRSLAVKTGNSHGVAGFVRNRSASR